MLEKSKFCLLIFCLGFGYILASGEKFNIADALSSYDEYISPLSESNNDKFVSEKLSKFMSNFTNKSNSTKRMLYYDSKTRRSYNERLFHSSEVEKVSSI